jgi:hypothetical protein
MLANPLGDIRLGSHHALIGRAVPAELEMFVLAIGGIGDGADSQDDFNQSVLPSKDGFAILRLILALRFEVPQKSRLEPAYRPRDSTCHIEAIAARGFLSSLRADRRAALSNI